MHREDRLFGKRGEIETFDADRCPLAQACVVLNRFDLDMRRRLFVNLESGQIDRHRQGIVHIRKPTIL